VLGISRAELVLALYRLPLAAGMAEKPVHALTSGQLRSSSVTANRVWSRALKSCEPGNNPQRDAGSLRARRVLPAVWWGPVTIRLQHGCAASKLGARCLCPGPAVTGCLLRGNGGKPQGLPGASQSGSHSWCLHSGLTAVKEVWVLWGGPLLSPLSPTGWHREGCCAAAAGSPAAPLLFPSCSPPARFTREKG